MKTHTTAYTFEGTQLPTNADELSFLVSKFLEHKLVKFLKMYPSKSDRESFMVSIASMLNWTVSLDDSVPTEFAYREDHRVSVDAAVESQKSDDSSVILAWHIEHPQRKYPQVGALWSMTKKTCSKTSGSTGFVDGAALLSSMSDEDRQFLSRCEIVQTSFFDLGENELTDRDIFSAVQSEGDRRYISVVCPAYSIAESRLVETTAESYLRTPIVKHPLTGEDLLRIDPKGQYVDGSFVGYDRLATFDGRRPTQSEDAKFNGICEWVMKSIYQNTDIQHWHYWDEGDTLLVDIFSMAHGVRGGFSVGERVLEGTWAFPKAISREYV